MSVRFPKGSEWRRWDLHIHTPESTLSNKFTDWDSYLTAIEAADAAICAIGVTDYASIEGYKRLRKEKEESNRCKNVHLLLPNIEFRISPLTKKGSAINIHLLIDPTAEDHIERIEDALNRLTFTFQGQKFPCNKEGLIRLGKAINTAAIDSQSAYREGMNQFKPDFDLFCQWFEGEKWLKQNSLVAVSNSNHDGASGLNHDDGYRAKRKEIYSFCDMIFSGNPEDRSYFLGQGTDSEEILTNSFGGRKPCIHGSDAHEIEKLFKPDMHRFCWIKADPTFEGLRQIIYEPEGRVHIGQSRPESVDENKIIQSIKIRASNGWFFEEELQFNPSLVSIIGSKGAGKTALLDLIAYTTGAWQNLPNSFLAKAYKELEGVQIIVRWAGGEEDTITLTKSLKNGGAPKVRYLSQQFVEQLCSEDKIGGELVQEIEHVIFEYLPETDKLGKASFSELREQRTQTVRRQRDRTRKAIENLNQEIEGLQQEIDSRPAKAEQIKKLKIERKGLERQIPSFATEEEERIENELSQLRQTRHDLIHEIEEQNLLLVKIADIIEQTTSFEVLMHEFYTKIINQLKEVELSEEDYRNFKPAFFGDTRAPMSTKEQKVKQVIDEKKGTIEDMYPEKKTLTAIEARISELEKRTSADQMKKEKAIEIQTRIAAIDAEIKKLEKALESIDGKKRIELRTKIEDRWEKYSSYFEIMREEQEILSSLYQTLSDIIEKGPDEKQDLEFHIKRKVDTSRWALMGQALIDKRKQGPYRVVGDLEKQAHELLYEAWMSGDRTTIRQSLETLRATFDDPAKDIALSSQLLSATTMTTFDNWFFNTEHISLSYGIRYAGTELENLSPGTKGIVLLILYLEMDQNDRRPLLIDQPEENLDNESVYRVLTGYFRKAKNRRQILLVTHNPNLVVNTDSEQVIVSTFLRSPPISRARIAYNAGSLEDSGIDRANEEGGIREKVCEILEGGERAFHMREAKYAFGRKQA